MAVHKEHTLRSFPSFPEIENFEDDEDEYDNNFIISLEDNGDEEEDFSLVTPSGTSVPYSSNSTIQNGDISSVSSQVGADSISKVPTSYSDKYCRNTVTYPQSQLTHLRSNVQPELQPGLYSSSKESQQCNYQHSLNGSLFSYQNHFPRSNLETEINDQTITVTSSCSNNINGTTTISKFTTDATDSSKLISQDVPAHFVHLDNQNHEQQSIKSHVSQQNLATSYSELPKMHLETIQLNKEAGGVWSEAVFLNTTEVSDSSFSDFGTSAVQNNVTDLPVSNNSTVPKLSGPYLKTSSPQIVTDCLWNIKPDSTANNLSEKVFQMQILNGNVSCSCVMCYKGKVNVGFQKSHNEDPRLTKHEKLSIFQKPTKRKKLAVSAIDSEKNNTQSKNVNFKMTCPQISSINTDMKAPRLKSYVSQPVSSALHTTSQMLDGVKTSNAAQSNSSSKSSVAAPKIIMLDMSPKCISTNTLTAYNNIASGGAKTSYFPYDPSKRVTVTNVSSSHAVTPTVPHIMSIPRLSSKVFLKPSEISGQKPQVVSSVLELNSGKTLNLSSSGQTSSALTQVSCKETPSTCVSPSASLTSPPSSKVIYVSSGQMFLYPHQTRTPVSILSVNKQPQAKASNASHLTVIKLPSGNVPNTISPKDSSFKTCHQNVLSQNSHLYLNKQDNLNSCAGTSKTIRRLLSGSEKIDITGSRKVILKLKPPVNNLVTHSEHMHTSQVITAAAGSNVSTVSTGPVHMISLLKNSPIARGVLSSASTCMSDAHSVSTKLGYLTSKTQASPGLGTPQTLVRLVNPVVQERPSTNSDNKIINIFRTDLQTSRTDLQTSQSGTINTSVHNAQMSGNGIPKTFHHALVLNPIDTLANKSPPEGDKSMQAEKLSSVKNASGPCPPQEGLPSTYIEDWVSKTTTYVSDQLQDIDSIQERHDFIPHGSDGDNEVLLPPSQDTPKESIPSNGTNKKIGSFNYTILQMPDGWETALDKQEAKTHLMLRSPTCADFQKQNTLQFLQSDSLCTSVSLNSSLSTTSVVDDMSMQKQLEQSPTFHRTGEKHSMYSRLHKRSQEIASIGQNSHSESGLENSMKSEDTPEWQLHTSVQSQPQSLSSILDSSKGIKLKIKLGMFRNENTQCKLSTDIAEPNVRNSENVSLSTGEVHLKDTDIAEPNVRNSENVPVSVSTGEVHFKECANINPEISGCDSDKQIPNSENSDRTETAEEMFQRFQEQAVQEVVNAQMGMGFVSRSLRPTRTTYAFLDKYPYRFGPGKPKKKGLNTKNVCAVSEKSGDSHKDTSKIDYLTETSDINKQLKKLYVRQKRQIEEAADEEIKSKQPKLSIKDYPRLKQDYSIIDSKTVYCTNILAGHKVYVKFNTFENICSDRAFLVPFFNIGGSRTQFDIEDMEYINKAVMDFESEERSCARHLLFYSRARNKAMFLRKETNLQTSHINDKNYRKCSFVLEGFRRNTTKQTESSPEHWKVDNTIDIEIDRAEVDNDIETEFDTHISLDGMADGQSIAAENTEGRKSSHTFKYSNYNGVENTGLSIRASVQSPLRSQNRHSSNIKIGACFSKVNVSGPVDTECDMSGAHTESEFISEMEETTAAVPCGSDLGYSDETCIYINRFQGQLNDFQVGDASRNVQVLHPKTCSRVKEEIPIDESDDQCSFGHLLNAAYIKKEKFGVDEECVQQLDTSHPVSNIGSVNSSPHLGRHGEHMLDEIVFIKNEPADDYFNSLEETEPCTPEDIQVKAPHLTNGKSSTNLSIKLIQQQKPADQTIHFTSEDIIISNTTADAAHLKNCVVHASDLQDSVTEPNTTASHTKITRPQLVDDIVPIQIHVGGSKISSLVPALTRRDIDQSCDIDDSISEKTASVTEPSLPESPLPSSSMSYSSEILASSDIDESDFSTISHSGVLVTKVTSDDEDIVNKPNIVRNKITSLVESLRHRLTQDTSNLPTWIASINTSTTKTKVKKRKMMKVKKKRLQCNTAQAQVSDGLSSSAIDISTSSQTISALSSPVLSSVSHSVHHGSSLLPSPSTSSVYLPTPSLPLDVLSSVVTSSVSTVSIPLISDPKGNSGNSLLLPVPDKVVHESYIKHVSTSDIWKTSKSYDMHVAECASNYIIDEKVSSETEDIIDIDDSFNIKHTAKTFSELSTDEGQSDFVSAPIKLPNAHFQAGFLDNDYAACSETLSPNGQSPLDFEIEIGKEDLPETAMSLQLILPSENLDLEALKLSRKKHIREHELDFSLLSSPKIATAFQQDDDGIKQLYPVTKNTSSLPKLKRCKTKHSKEKSCVINTQSCVSDHHTGKLQVSEDSETRQDGSVASYLCKKFSSQGKHHNIKGPRLLHMPSNRRSSITEASKQKIPVQNTPNAVTHAGPITTEELFKTPSLDEIFGASIKKEMVVSPENKVDSVAVSPSQISVDSISRTKQRIIHQHTSKVQISKKKKQNKKVKKNATFSSDASSSMVGELEPKIVASTINSSLPVLTSHSVNNQTESGSEVLPKMNVCKVVLRKLELSSFDRLSENVFKIRKTAVKERPYVRLTKIDSDSVSHVNNSKSTFKRVVKRKRRKITRPGFRHRGDIIDYYNYMLENLHKKQQQLEEETRKQEAAESAKKVQLESIRSEKVTLLEKSIDANERDEIVAGMTGQETNNTETEDVKNDNPKEACGMKVEVDCLLQPSECITSLEAPVNTVSTNNKDEPACRPTPECDILSEKTKDNNVVDCVCLTDIVSASKKGKEACIQNGAAVGFDSDWPYLQKFCDEAIFSHGNIDYLQKVNDDICIPSINEGRHCAPKFEKKDVVLCSNVDDKAAPGEFNSCETLSNTEDASSCIEQSSDEQDMGIVDDVEILLDLKIKSSSEFICDDQETRKLSFSQSPTDMNLNSVDGRNIDTNCNPRGMSLDQNTSSAVTVGKENTQPVPAACQLEPTDPATGVLNVTSNSRTAAIQPLADQNVSVKHEKPQRTVDISPSWERLLGHNSIDISSQYSDDTTASQQETSQNHDVSFVTSSNFKSKFKLPKGILSQARRLSRDMKNMSEQPSSNVTLLSKSEILSHKSLDDNFTNNSNPADNYKKLPEHEDSSEGRSDYVSSQPYENQKTPLISKMSVSKLKFNSVTLNAIHRAKAEFLQKRASKKRCIDGSTFEYHSENITKTLKDEQVYGVGLASISGKENALVQHQESSDIDQKLAPDRISYISGQENNELSKSSLDTICSDLSLNDASSPAPNKQLSSINANIDCKEVDVKADVQAEMSASDFGDLTTNSALPSMCLTHRKDGIFSNLDLFQGCDADTPKQTNEQSSSKEVQADNISKVNAIDIKKLKLKLKPLLLGKFKGNTNKGFTTLQQSTPISRAMIEKLAQKSFHKLRQKLNPLNVAKQKVPDLIVDTAQQSVGNTSVVKTITQHYGVASAALLDLQARHSESDPSNVVNDKPNTNISQSQPVNSSSHLLSENNSSVLKLNDKLDVNISQSHPVSCSSDLVSKSVSSNVVKLIDRLDANISQSQSINSSDLVSESDSSNVKLNGHAIEKLDTNISQSHPVNSSSDNVSLSTYRQLSQVNTTKLCTILKNFQKAGSTINSVPTNSEDALSNFSAEIIVDNQDVSLHTPKLQRCLKKSCQLDCAAAGAGSRQRPRGKRKKCQRVSAKHEAMINTDMTQAKRIKQISLTSCVPGTPREQLGEEHHGSVCNNEQLDSEDKAERSFVDCLFSVPLDAWE